MESDKEWTDREKLLARIISWGLIIAVVLIIVGGLWTTIEILVNPDASTIGIWFTSLTDWTIQVLVIGGLVVGILMGIIIFSIFIRKGQRFILDLLFKIEE